MSNKLKPAVNSNDHIEGNTSAVIELLEFGDVRIAAMHTASSSKSGTGLANT